MYGEAAGVVVLEVSGEPDPPTQFRALGATHSAIQLRCATGESCTARKLMWSASERNEVS